MGGAAAPGAAQRLNAAQDQLPSRNMGSDPDKMNDPCQRCWGEGGGNGKRNPQCPQCSRIEVGMSYRYTPWAGPACDMTILDWNVAACERGDVQDVYQVQLVYKKYACASHRELVCKDCKTNIRRVEFCKGCGIENKKDVDECEVCK